MKGFFQHFNLEMLSEDTSQGWEIWEIISTELLLITNFLKITNNYFQGCKLI